MPVLMAERVDRPPSLFDPDPGHVAAPAHDEGLSGGPTLDEGLSGGPTLDDAIVGAWEGLAARAVVPCPVCGGALRPHEARESAGGRCDDCGTTLR